MENLSLKLKLLQIRKKLQHFILTMQNLLLNIFHLLKVLKGRIDFFQLKKKIILIQT